LLVVLRSSASASEWSAGCSSRPASHTDDALAQQVRHTLLATKRSPTAGFEVVDLDSCTEVVGWKSDHPFPTASVVKLLIAIDVLVTDGPDNAPTERLHQMLAASDDNVASAFWSERGATAIVTRMAAKLSLQDTRPPADPGQWGSTMMSPRDVATVYRYLTSTMDADSRDVITDALSGAQRNAADGFDQYFGIPNAMTGKSWAIKQGWGSSGPHRVLNTTGIVHSGHRYAVIVMTTWPKTIDWPTATGALTAAVHDLRPVLSSGPHLS
jgi:hypothetical protein